MGLATDQRLAEGMAYIYQLMQTQIRQIIVDSGTSYPWEGTAYHEL